jgi:hypothetical protein
MDRVGVAPRRWPRSGPAHLDFAGRQRLVRLLLERVVITGDHVPIEPCHPAVRSFAGLRLRDRRVSLSSCGGRMRVVATIEDPVVMRRILTHLGLRTEASAPRPPPSDLFDWS